LGVPFFELSKEVERAYGGPIGLLIELGGQAALRRFEEEAWQNIVQQNADAVIAASGGIVAEGALFDQLLETSHVVWLKAAPEDHMTRVMAQGDFRPMSANRTAMTDLKAILDARSREYSRADVTLNTSEAKFEATLGKLENIVRDLVPYPRRGL
jgi:XRE family aerobic/anaerobic benzoate catabolism transcriptional regulator